MEYRGRTCRGLSDSTRADYAQIIAKILGHQSDAITRRIYIHPPESPRFDQIDP